MTLSNIVFLILMLATFGYFFYRLYTIWNWMQLGKGDEDLRYDQIAKRIKGVFVTAFLQPKMFRDLIPGIVHALIFWGFIAVTIWHY